MHFHMIVSEFISLSVALYLGYCHDAIVSFYFQGAKMVVAEGGQFPKTVSSLRKIPGIGDYTAGAIASIAFKVVSILKFFFL